MASPPERGMNARAGRSTLSLNIEHVLIGTWNTRNRQCTIGVNIMFLGPPSAARVGQNLHHTGRLLPFNLFFWGLWPFAIYRIEQVKDLHSTGNTLPTSCGNHKGGQRSLRRRQELRRPRERYQDCPGRRGHAVETRAPQSSRALPGLSWPPRTRSRDKGSAVLASITRTVLAAADTRETKT